jgi:hypothetical protein
MDALDLPDGFDVCSESEAAELLKRGFVYIGAGNDIDPDEAEKRNFIRLVSIKRRDYEWHRPIVGYFAVPLTDVQTARAKYLRKLKKLASDVPSDNESLHKWVNDIGRLVAEVTDLPDNVHPYPNDEDIYIQE